jgi:hypothetical protein
VLRLRAFFIIDLQGVLSQMVLPNVDKVALSYIIMLIRVHVASISPNLAIIIFSVMASTLVIIIKCMNMLSGYAWLISQFSDMKTMCLSDLLRDLAKNILDVCHATKGTGLSNNVQAQV